MEHLRKFRLLDAKGQPLSARVDDALNRLVPRFRRRFPVFRDIVDILTIFEAVGTRIEERERLCGPIEPNLEGYAWASLKAAAYSKLRLSSARLEAECIRSDDGASILSMLHATEGSQKQIEDEICMHQVEKRLSDAEQFVLTCKKAGLSSKVIARARGSSVGAVDVLYSRAKEKIRKMMKKDQE